MPDKNKAKQQAYQKKRDWVSYNKRRRDKLWSIVEEHKTQCLFCGTTENLEFHHVDTNERSMGSVYDTTSVTKLKQELAKCWCLCKSCHTKLHQRLVDPLPVCYDEHR